jgi:hypothetical protein
MVLAADLAADLADVTSEGDGGVVTYRRGATVFARVSPDALDLRLPADIAEAALRTPDTAPADVPGRPAGPPPAAPAALGWVRFSPHGRERHVMDRAAAWLHTAWRHAGGGEPAA